MNFSVLISVYYKENPDYLIDCLQSIIEQTVQPSEIVIIKDGPLNMDLDNVIDNFLKRYPSLFKIIPLDKNYGLGYALNVGILNCNNELIARMDSDDICIKNRFELQLKEFDRDNDLSICSGYVYEFEGNIENIISLKKLPLTNDEILKYSRKRNPFNHMAVMYKKSKVIEAGNYMEVNLAEDYYLWVRMLMNSCKAKNIDSPLVYVRGGNEMFKRRGGLSYAKKIFRLQKMLYNIGYINRCEFMLNCSVRIIISIIPTQLREIFYNKILRN